MLRSVWLLFVYISFLGLGATVPFILALGYIWVDTFRPQEVAYIILDQLPVAMIIGAAALGGYVVFDRRDPPRVTLIGMIPAIMAIWCTLTMIWAVVPDYGWTKWDWAFKTLMFSAFLPYIIRSRVQIEAMAQVYLFALAGNFVPFGIKTMISGGGYGMNLGLASGNSGMAEGGLLSTFCLMAVPIAYFLMNHGQLIPKHIVTRGAYLLIIVLSIVTAIGTYERSALLGLAVLGIYMFMRSKQKVLFGIVLAIGVAVLAYSASDRFAQRMNTIGTYNADSSALVRLLVWKWTLEFSFTHPLGGGFNAFTVNVIEVPGDEANPGGETQHGRAFHSIYFEVLGEQGWPGIVLFGIAGIGSIVQLRRLSRRIRNKPHLAWCVAMSDALQSGLMVFLSAGTFVGIAFQPIFWYFVVMGVSLREYARRVDALENPKQLTGWRGTASARPTPGRLPLPAGGQRV